MDDSVAFLVTYSLCMFSASQTVHSLVVQVRFNGAIWGFPMGSGSGGPHSGEMDDGTCFYGVDSVCVVVKSANNSGVPRLVLAHLSQPPLGVSVHVACRDGRGSVHMDILLFL